MKGRKRLVAFLGVTSLLLCVLVPGCVDNATVMFATTGNYVPARTLIALGGNINSRTGNDEKTALMYAVESGNETSVKTCLELGCDPNAIYKDTGCPVLFGTAGEGPYGKVALLVQYGANVNMACNDGRTPLVAARSGSNTSIIQLLIDHGAREPLAR